MVHVEGPSAFAVHVRPVSCLKTARGMNGPMAFFDRQHSKSQIAQSSTPDACNVTFLCKLDPVIDPNCSIFMARVVFCVL
jgi:hypothetical protein